MTFRFTFLEAEPDAKTANGLIEEAESLSPAVAEVGPISTLAELAAVPALIGARLRRLQAFGVVDAEAIAQRLEVRDSEHDDRTLCFECIHCRKRGCAMQDAWLPRTLQRCDKFRAALMEARHV
jgi:hypothetical protein